MNAKRMTPRERVLCALSHRQPDRVPFSWGFGPTWEMGRCLEQYLRAQGISWARLRAEVEDIQPVWAPYTGPAQPPHTDIWGIRRAPMAHQGGAYEEIEFYPLAGIESVEQLGKYPWPDPTAYDDRSLRQQVLASDPQRLRAKRAFSSNPFEIYCWMTGLEEAMVNLVANPPLVMAALERITGFFEVRLQRGLSCYGDLLDVLFWADDLGGQNGLLISRECYRQVLQPFHRRLADTMARLAPHARRLFHSDGSVFDILPDLIDAGVQVLEAVQTDAAKMDPRQLKSTYGRDVCFHGGISVQQLLPHAEEATVEAECRRLVQVFGEGGGYVAAPSHAIQVGTPPQNVLAMLRGVLGEEDYQAAMQKARG